MQYLTCVLISTCHIKYTVVFEYCLVILKCGQQHNLLISGLLVLCLRVDEWDCVGLYSVVTCL